MLHQMIKTAVEGVGDGKVLAEQVTIALWSNQ
jgi:hypothetical protein